MKAKIAVFMTDNGPAFKSEDFDEKKLFEHMSMTSSQRYPQQSDKVKCTFKIMNVKVSRFPMIKCSVLSLTVNHTT